MACSWTSVAFALEPLPTPTPIETPPPVGTPPPISPPPLSPVDLCTAAVTSPTVGSLQLHCTSNVFPLVSAAAGETIVVQLRFPLTAAGTTLGAGPLDGGTVSGDGLSIALDGTVTVQFQTSSLPGLYRVALNAGGQITTMQFSVPNPPEESPTPSPEQSPSPSPP